MCTVFLFIVVILKNGHANVKIDGLNGYVSVLARYILCSMHDRQLNLLWSIVSYYCCFYICLWGHLAYGDLLQSMFLSDHFVEHIVFS